MNPSTRISVFSLRLCAASYRAAVQMPFVLSCIGHLKSDILDLSSYIGLTAESRLLIAEFVLQFQRQTPSLSLCNAQIAKAAAIREPTAALGGSSRASRMAVA